MLDAAIQSQLKAYLEKLQRPVELVASLDDSAKALEMRALLEAIAPLSEKVSLRFDGNAALRPSFGIPSAGESARIHFAGIPMGHEFTSLVLALLQTGGHPPKIEPELIERIKALPGGGNFETFVSLSCHNCPDVVQAFNLIAVLNPGYSHTMIDGAVFPALAEQRQIMAVTMEACTTGRKYPSRKMSRPRMLLASKAAAAAFVQRPSTIAAATVGSFSASSSSRTIPRSGSIG